MNILIPNFETYQIETPWYVDAILFFILIAIVWYISNIIPCEWKE
jgi:hypothetical protein